MDTQQQKQFKILLLGDTCKDIYQYGYVDRISPEAPVPVFVKTNSQEKYGMVDNVLVNLITLGCKVDVIRGEKSTKTRLIDIRSKQQIVRIDEDVYSEPIDDIDLNVDARDFDAIVISDYDKGFITYELVSRLRVAHNIPIFIDSFRASSGKSNILAYCEHNSCTDIQVTLFCTYFLSL